MESKVVERISKSVTEINLPKLQSTYSNAWVKGRVINAKVVGVTFDGRQEVVARLQKGDRIWLEQEPNNPFDPKAIKVCRSNGEQIGYLSRQLAANISPYFRAYRYPVKGKVKLLTGSAWEDYSLGVVITFKLPKTKSISFNKTNTIFDEWNDWDY
jgi:hypothetical protein